MSKPLIIGISGAPLEQCRTVNLLSEALQAAKDEGARTRLIYLKKYIRTHFDGRRGGNEIPGRLGRLFSLLMKADGIILASPVYWFMPADRMQTFLCYLSVFEAPDFELKGKAAGSIALCEEDGGQMTADTMARVLEHMGCNIPPFGKFFRNKNMAGRSEYGWQTKDHRLVGRNVARLARLLAKQTGTDWNGS